MNRTAWSKGDVFFLVDALARGMSFADVAGFLCRTEHEVRHKCKELSAKQTRAALDNEDARPRLRRSAAAEG
jgi:hypothetical protein